MVLANLLTLGALAAGAQLARGALVLLHLVLSIGLLFAALYLFSVGPLQRRLGDLTRNQGRLNRLKADWEQRSVALQTELQHAKQQVEAEIREREGLQRELTRVRRELEQRLHEGAKALHLKSQELEASRAAAEAAAKSAAEAATRSSTDIRPQPKVPSPVVAGERRQDQAERELRLEIASNVVGGLAHELNNALAPILLSVDLLRSKSLDREAEAALAGIETSVERSAELLRQTLTFARGVEGERMLVWPGLLLKEMVAMIREMFPRAIQVVADAAAGLWAVRGDAGQLQQALLKICANARDAMPEGGILRLKARNVSIEPAVLGTASRPPGPYVVIDIQDTGPGIPASMQARMFEPFWTSHDHSHAKGLGLSTALGIVRSHGGFLEVQSQPGAGTTITVFLPATSPPTAPTTSAEAEGELPRGNGELLLLVEEEPNLRELAGTTLLRYGYSVLTAADGVEALGVVAQQHGQLRLILTSITVPSMDGPSLARAARKIDPTIRVIAASTLGTSSLQTEKLTALQSLGISRLLAKPYTTPELLRAVKEELAPAGPG